MKKINIKLKEEHLRKLVVALANMIIENFGKNFSVKTRLLGELCVDMSSDGEAIKENIDNIKDLLDEFAKELDGMDDLLKLITVSEPQIELNPNETVIAKLGKKGAQQLPDGSWETLD
jgi:hypothetical protein